MPVTRKRKYLRPCWAHHPRGGIVVGYATNRYNSERKIAASREAAQRGHGMTFPDAQVVFTPPPTPEAARAFRRLSVRHFFPNGTVERGTVHAEAVDPAVTSPSLPAREWRALARRDRFKCQFHPDESAARAAAGQ